MAMFRGLGPNNNTIMITMWDETRNVLVSEKPEIIQAIWKCASIFSKSISLNFSFAFITN